MANHFRLGHLVITAAAKALLAPEDLLISLQRHSLGDWGDLCDEDRQENEFSMANGFRLLSAYQDRNDTTFWIITEADRSATTVLLPDDY